jgi:4-methyl-5(b-hydroxyethyl)-thiazole monophosphate biosynthesis
MPKVAIILAEGFEELEAVAIIDVLGRAGIDVISVGLNEGPVSSARKIKVIPDTIIDELNSDDFDMLVLPGGQPGSDNLNADKRVGDLIRDFNNKGKVTGAICAAPYVLANAGVLEGKHATSYPSFKEKLGNVEYEEKPVVTDGNVMTSRGPGTAICFGLAIVERFSGPEKAQQIKEAMLVDQDC